MSSYRRSDSEKPPAGDASVPGDAGLGMPTGAVARPLTVPLLVRGSFWDAWTVRLVWVCVIVMAASSIALVSEGLEPTVLVAGAACAALAVSLILYQAWQANRRCWLEVTATGFVLNSREGKQTWSDAEVVGVSWRQKTNFDGVTRQHVVLEVGDQDEARRIVCVYDLAGQDDPLSGFWQRLNDNLIRRIATGLPGGARLLGDGWRLDAIGLHSREGVCPLERVVRTYSWSYTLDVWRDEEEWPFLRLPMSGRNVPVLASVLRVLLHPPYTPIPGKPLGRVLLTCRGKDEVIGLLLVGLVIPAAILFLALVSVEPPLPVVFPGMFATAGTLTLVMGVFLIWRGLTRRLAVHECGVSLHGGGKPTELWWGVISEVICRDPRRLEIRPVPGMGLPTIRFRTMPWPSNCDFATARDALCWGVALTIGWREQLEEGPVKWTKSLRFLHKNLEFRNGDSPEDVERVPYDKVRYRVGQRYFHLSIGDEPEVVFQERINEPNFFVGLMLLNHLWERSTHRTDEADAAPRDFGPISTNSAPPGSITS